MLKSVRDGLSPDPMFGSDQEQMYQGMADDQLAIQLSKGKGFGLADMLVRQLQKMGVKGADAAASDGTGGGAGAAATGQNGASAAARAKATAAYSATERATTSSTTSDAAKTNFVQDLWPQAQQAGQLLGVDPRHL